MLHMTERRQKSVKQDFIIRLSASYSGSLRRYATDFRNRYNTVLVAKQLRGSMPEDIPFALARTVTRYVLMRQTVETSRPIAPSL